MKSFLLEMTKPTRVGDAAAAAQTDINSASVDCAGFDGIMFIVLFGTLTTTHVTTVKAESSSDDGDADAFAEIEGSETPQIGDASSNKIAIVDVRNPPERYVRCTVDRGTANAVVDGIIAIPYHAREIPTAIDADVDQYTKTVAA